jgi:hypothetical protein
MHSNPRRQDIDNILMMIEAAERFQGETLEESFNSRSLSFLLLEEVTDSEAAALDKAVDDTRKSLDVLNKVFPGDAAKMSDTKNYFKKLSEELPGAGFMAKVMITGDVKKMKKATEQASSTMVQVQAAKDSFLNAVNLLGSNLMKLPYGQSTDRDQTKTLKDISNLPDEERGEVPDEAALRKGIQRSWVPSKESKGLFGKVMAFFKGKLGVELDKGTFVNEMMELTWDELMAMANSTAQYTDQDKSDDSAGAATEEVADDLEAAPEDAAEENAGTAGAEGSEGTAGAEGSEDTEDAEIEAAAEEVAADVGTGPISGSDFGNMLKSHPDLLVPGKKGQRARKKFRKAINKIANKEIFQEGISYTMNEMIDTSVSALNEKREFDDLVVYRWNKLAGLK